MSANSIYTRSFFCAASTLIPSRIINLYSPKTILPAYHLVTDNTPLHIKHLYKPRSQKEFIEDLDFILKFYKPIDLHELTKLNKEGNKRKENCFHLSFDDGLRECADIVSPILKEKGIPATFFLNPDFIDNKDLMFRYKASLLIDRIAEDSKHKKSIPDIKCITYKNKSLLDDLAQSIGLDFSDYLKNQRPYMNHDQINQLINDGFTIGAHSMDHPKYSQISLEEQIKQTKNSVNYITQYFNIKYKVFAFPFNDDLISKTFFDSIFNTANPIADLTFGVAGIKKDYHTNHLQRIPMEGKYSGNSLIKGEYLYYYLKKLIGQNTITRF